MSVGMFVCVCLCTFVCVCVCVCVCVDALLWGFILVDLSMTCI